MVELLKTLMVSFPNIRELPLKGDYGSATAENLMDDTSSFSPLLERLTDGLSDRLHLERAVWWTLKDSFPDITGLLLKGNYGSTTSARGRHLHLLSFV